jgi:hypothetical protein
MPGLTSERIKFLNKQLKKQHVALSSSYLKIREDFSARTSMPAGVIAELKPQYKLVRMTRDTDSVLQEFEPRLRPRGLDLKTSLDEICEEEERKKLSPSELIRYKAKLQQDIKNELVKANLELYYKELGARPNLSPRGVKLFRRGSIILLVAGILIPFGSIFIFFGLIGLFFGPKIINFFMKKRFDKKSALQKQDAELTAELDALCDTYCVEHEIAPWTVNAVAKGDNEDQLFDVVRPAQLQWMKLAAIEPSSEDALFDAPLARPVATA